MSRRRFVAVAGAAGISAFAGCSAESGEGTTTETERPTSGASATADSPKQTTTETATEAGTETETGVTDELVDAIEAEAVPFEISASSGGLDAVASGVASSPIVGIGENSHGVREFKTLPNQLVRRLVADHGYRLVAMEGTLGDFAPVDEYVTGETDDLDAAMASLEFYFWQADGIRDLFEWLRTFNEDRPETDQAVVRGYDAQFHDVNADALLSYFERVDPDYLDAVEDRLEALTTPLYEDSDAAVMTDEHVSLVEDLRTRLRDHEAAYVDASSESEWELALRHVWTMERGLEFVEAFDDERYTEGKTVRDRAMAENVAWLREWTGVDRAVVLGNSNHTMRGYGASEQRAARMGQHLTDRFGSDYYSLGQLFGTGSFNAPRSEERDTFETFALGDPVEDTLAPALTAVSRPRFFLDFEEARERAVLDTWLDSTEQVQFTVPRAAKRGTLPLPAAPGDVFDGVLFVSDVSPASFSTGA